VETWEKVQGWLNADENGVDPKHVRVQKSHSGGGKKTVRVSPEPGAGPESRNAGKKTRVSGEGGV